jgi:Family of unknown function (DUF5317)
VILYGLGLGIALGLLLRGRLMALAYLELHWSWVGLAAIGFQLLLFSTPLGNALGPVAPVAYVLSTGAVLLAVIANLHRPGMPLVAVGAVFNLAAVVANGGYMPSTASALALAGRTAEGGYTNSVVLGQPALAPLTDIFAVPWLVPLANVFSIGDLLIAAGVCLLVVRTMLSSAHAATYLEA